MHTVPAAVCLVVMPGNRSRHVVQVDTSSEASWEWNLLILDWTAGWFGQQAGGEEAVQRQEVVCVSGPPCHADA